MTTTAIVACAQSGSGGGKIILSISISMGEFLQINTNVEQENRSTPMKGSSMRRRKCVVMNRIQYMGNVRSWYRSMMQVWKRKVDGRMEW